MSFIVSRIETLAFDALELDVQYRGGKPERYLYSNGRPTEVAKELALGAVLSQSQGDLIEMCDLITMIGVGCNRGRSKEVYPEDGMNPIELRRKFRNRAVIAYCDPRPLEDLSARWHMVYTKLCHLTVLGLEALNRNSAPRRYTDGYDGLIRHEPETRPVDYDAVRGYSEERAHLRDLLRDDPDFDILPAGHTPVGNQQ